MSATFRAAGAGADYSGLEGFTTLTTITGATKANPCVLTVDSSTPIVNGEAVTLRNVGGMTELEGLSVIFSNKSGSTVEIDVDSTAFTTFTSGGDIDQGMQLPMPAGVLEDDFIYFFGGRNDTNELWDQVPKDPSGGTWIQVGVFTDVALAPGRTTTMYYKRATGNEPALLDILNEDTAADQCSGIIQAYSGVDWATGPFDLTPTTAHFDENQSDILDAVCKPITTVGANALVVLAIWVYEAGPAGITAYGPPSGYTQRGKVEAPTARGLHTAEKLIVSATTETPGATTNTASGSGTGTDHVCCTFALKELVAAGGSIMNQIQGPNAGADLMNGTIQ